MDGAEGAGPPAPRGVQCALFDTPIGACGIAWSGGTVRRIQLPEACRADTARRLRAELGPSAGVAEDATPPAWVRRAMASMARHLDGGLQDFTGLSLDFSGVTPFRRRVYEEASRIPAGATVTYGELAARVGAPRAARAVGQAMGKNPFPIVVPCHRVVATGGGPGGFSAHGGIDTKARMLEIEGASTGPSS